MGQMEDSVNEWSFGPEEDNDLLAKLRRLADFQGWGVDFEKFGGFGCRLKVAPRPTGVLLVLGCYIRYLSLIHI